MVRNIASRAGAVLTGAAAGLGAALLRSGAALAAPPSGGGPIPSQLGQPVDLSQSPFVQAIFVVLSYVLPIIGGVILAYGLWGVLQAVWQSAKGEKVQSAGTIINSLGGQSAFVHRIVEILIGFIIVALALSGKWVDLTNALYNVTVQVFQAFVNALNGHI